MLVHLPSKSLVLKLRNPARVTEVIPNSRVVEKDGQQLTQVKYGLDEVKVLNNLGIKAPSPINYFYDWQGKFKPFSHQRETSAFFTLNPRSICLNDMGCVDATTEYLSPTGWRRMDDYDGGQVAQWLPDERRYEFVAPTEYVKKPCHTMLRFLSENTDQMLSCEHRVLLYYPSLGGGLTTKVMRADEVASRFIYEPESIGGVSDDKGDITPMLPGGSKVMWEGTVDGYKYCFMVPSTFLLLRRNGCIFATGNTGKTLSVLWAADYLMQLGKIRRAIIVCPKSVMSVWENELHSHFLFSRRCVVLHGSKARRLKMLEQDVPFYIINHDGIKTIEKELKAKGFDLWVIDEAAAFRNAQSNRSKCLNRLITDVFWMWMLTGTPCPTLPTDAWALGRMLRSPLAPKYFSNFKSQVMTQVTPFKWVPKPDAYATAYAVLQPGVRYKKEDCIDLPPVTFQHYDCDQTKEQKDAFKEMQKELVMDVGGNKITAANAGVKLNKLLQVCCGEVYDNNGNATTINSLNRLQTCNEIVEQARHKVLVFVPFTAALNQVANYLRKKGHSVAVVDGRTSVGKRKKIFDDFQNTDEPRVLVAHPQTTAHGLTLTRADTTIWYAPIFSLEIFEQANNRMSRPGQKNKMTVAMICSSWLERKVYEALENKAHMQNSVLELYKKAANAPA